MEGGGGSLAKEGGGVRGRRRDSKGDLESNGNDEYHPEVVGFFLCLLRFLIECNVYLSG